MDKQVSEAVQWCSPCCQQSKPAIGSSEEKFHVHWSVMWVRQFSQDRGRGVCVFSTYHRYHYQVYSTMTSNWSLLSSQLKLKFAHPYLIEPDTVVHPLDMMSRENQKVNEAFSVAETRIWNQLPTELKTTKNTAAFKCKLKAYSAAYSQ